MNISLRTCISLALVNEAPVLPINDGHRINRHAPVEAGVVLLGLFYTGFAQLSYLDHPSLGYSSEPFSAD
jgi:hypothetical protein